MVEANHTKIYANVEKLSVKEGFEGGPKKLRIQGLALPFGKVSRNGVLYRRESIEKQYESLIGKPLLFNHNMEGLPIGKVNEVTIKEDGMYYEAEVDENEQQIAQKIKNGYIQNVSIQCMIENPDFKEDGTVIVDVKEFLELSAVTIPGFADATAAAIEKLKMVEKKESVKTEQDGEDSNEYTLEDAKAEIESLKTRNQELEDRLSVVESRLDADEETEEEMDEEETEEESTDEEETEEESTDEEDSEEEMDEEEEKPKEKLKRKAVPRSTQKAEANKVLDMRAKRLESMGY